MSISWSQLLTPTVQTSLQTLSTPIVQTFPDAGTTSLSTSWNTWTTTIVQTHSSTAIVVPSITTIISTTSSSPNRTQKAQTNNSSSGLSGGAVAGIAIGCLIIGIILALIGAFLAQRRRRKHTTTAITQNHLPATGKSEYGRNGIPSQAAGAKGLDLLPQPVEDAVITGELSKLRDDIKNHVQTYYLMQNTQFKIYESALTEIGAALGVSTSYVAKLLANPTTLDDTLRSYISWIILSKYQSCLPKGLLDTIPSVSGDRNPELFSRWKVLTGVLLKESYEKNEADMKIDAQNEANILGKLDRVLKLFVSRDVDDAKRLRNLKLIIGRAEKLIFLLFSQPGSFEFRFNEGKGSGIAVFPSLVQVVDDDAHVLRHPRTLFGTEFLDAREFLDSRELP
ncbi:hypothetical protein DM02DRAFT_691984 [Periconia macrospinosa]|uniref:Uncharacterized protein n=1 Tax=Periconia macrospinosa TaxID=97972 RepID=A0A2V1DCR6_9PLEO|nr:hypothetical protein DM02DRAFT_691984 [Periconia macrospinosa]